MKNWQIILIIIILGFAVFANTFQNQMFWDDDDNILNNTFVHSFSLDKFFSENLIAGAGLSSNYWRPALLTIFSLEWQLWDTSVFGYHFVNTSIHILAAIALFYLLFRLFKHKLLAFLTTLIFLVHPAQTEAVTYISGLGDPLSGLFIFLGIIFYLRFRDSGKASSDNWDYFGAIGMYVLALMSKDSAVVMPALVALVDFFYLPKDLTTKEKLKIVARAIWPFFVVFGIYTLLRATSLNFINTFNLYNEQNEFTSNFFARLFTFFSVIARYFALMLFPINLHFEKVIPWATSLFASEKVFIGALITTGLLGIAFSQIKKSPVISFGIFWFLFRLFPHSNLLVPTSGLMHDHWLYMPLVGVFLALFWILLTYTNKSITVLITILMLAFFSSQTIARNRDWKDPITFYNQTLEYSPDNYRVINNLGKSYAEANRQKEAIDIYTKAIELDPKVSVAHHNLGNSYLRTGQTEKAIEKFNEAIALQPDFIFSYNALAKYYLENGDYVKTRETYESFIPYAENPVEYLLLLRNIALEEKNNPKAKEYLEQALKLDSSLKP
jgi:protein O-mannosyl-transferase